MDLVRGRVLYLPEQVSTLMLALDDRNGLRAHDIWIELHQLSKFSLVEVPDHVVLVVFDRRFGQRRLEDLAAVDLVLYRVSGDEAVDYNVSLLADSVASVD